jgi:hypothetical protein
VDLSTPIQAASGPQVTSPNLSGSALTILVRRFGLFLQNLGNESLTGDKCFRWKYGNGVLI